MNIPITETNLIISAIVLGMLGFVQCFFGYRFFRIILAVLGFFIGMGIGASLVANAQPVVVVLVSLICGAIGAILFYYLYFIGTFLAGIALGSSLAAVLIANFDVTPNTTTIVIVLGAVIGGILGILLSKYIIMLATAFTGSAELVYAVLLLFARVPAVSSVSAIEFNLTHTTTPLVTLAILALAIVGFVVQLNMNARLTYVEPVV